MKAQKNPKWTRDEIILALNVYFKMDNNKISKNNPEIQKLSNLLSSLEIHGESEREKTFRNVNGVALKLANFVSLDPEGTKGMESSSKLDRELFTKYYHNRKELENVANNIEIAHEKSILNLSTIDEEFEADEGKTITRLHRMKERNNNVVLRKKNNVLLKTGKLCCEVCDIDFNEFYGDIGKGFIECHHNIPLASIEVEVKTKLEDLSLLCSNCHRMIHRTKPLISVQDFKKKINAQNTAPPSTG